MIAYFDETINQYLYHIFLMNRGECSSFDPKTQST
jgi:hypothetical protein